MFLKSSGITNLIHCKLAAESVVEIVRNQSLSVVSAVFDPIDLIIPYTVKTRLLLKEIWRLNGQRSNDHLPDDISDRFLESCSAFGLILR